MTENPADLAPPEWAIKEAVRRLGSAVAGREVKLEEIRWAVGRLGDEPQKSLFYVVKGMEDKANVADLAMVTSIAANIAAEVN